VKVTYRKAASDDVVRQFRYYLVVLNLPNVPFASERLSGKLFNGCSSTRWWVRAIVPATRSFRLFARGQLRDSRPSGFITFWTKTRSASFGFCTASAILNAFLNVREVFDVQTRSLLTQIPTRGQASDHQSLSPTRHQYT
jgi:hypothetical protein